MGASAEFNRRSNKHRVFTTIDGFTLLEVLVALVILSISILGLTATILTSIQSNLRNELRNTAVGLSSQISNELISSSIDEISDISEVRSMNVRGATIPYLISCEVSGLSHDTIQIDISVQYSYRGQNFANNTVLYKHRSM
jgi:prepilin-type N-terminal cleavage/methylation domain-containing protein